MRAFEYLLSRPLAVTPEALEAAIAIVTRDPAVPAPEAVEARKGQPIDGSESGMVRRDGVAVIPVTGPIFRYADFFTDLCGGATVESIARDLHLAANDPTVRAILLSIDSPGGEAAGIGELAGMIRAASAIKPCTAYVSSQGCSAAYWLAAAAGEVVCADTAMLGSIGVVMGYTVREPRPGTKSYEFVSSQSPNKRPNPETETGRAEIQRTVDDLAEVFIAAVATYRGTTAEKVQSDFGRGGVLVGKKAVDAGMADRVGTFENTLKQLAAGKVPGRSSAVANASREDEPPMFGFLFKPKADGSFSMQPLADDGAPAAAVEAAAASEQPATAKNASAAAQTAELAELRKQLAESKLETIKATAAGWYDGLFASDKIVPAERDAALGAFVQASLDDLAHPLAGGVQRVAGIQSIYAARTPHTLCKEQLAGDGPAPAAPSNLPPGYKTVDAAGDASKPPTKERLTALMQHLVTAGHLGAEHLPK